MKSKVHPTYKEKYRVANWASYDRALVRRGDVVGTFWRTACCRGARLGFHGRIVATRPSGMLMPIYEFICLNCKRRRKPFEVIQSASSYNPKKVKCPKCGSKRVERHWSTVFTVTSRKS